MEPVLESSVTLFAFSFVIHALPLRSIAIAGWPVPPTPGKPVGGETGEPELENSEALFPVAFATQAFPEPSIAMP